MVPKEFFVLLLFYVSIVSASEYRSGFRNRKENDYKDRETEPKDAEDTSATRQKKRKWLLIISPPANQDFNHFISNNNIIFYCCSFFFVLHCSIQE